ncbi:glutathione S-transferase-like [Mya arenaria]|uniref:glutathione S-transferase-like n=1 Tax=Mya arenaria TaxID=6604 RepID=UPI0022E9244A|nr:glutathione S-transferase-like [Mya arenaria]
MPSYKFTYFNGKGRAEVSRLLFAAAGKAFDDVRIDSAQWSDLKKVMPQGTLPVLEVGGKTKISQSVSIARYLAREFDLYGKGNTEMALVDQIIDTTQDLLSAVLKFAFLKDEAEKAKKREEFLAGDAKKYLGFLENLVKEGGKSGFAVGSSLTVADLMLYAFIENSQIVELLKDYKLLDANRKKVEQLPKIKEYLKKRPVTTF